jgi:hypothetical protein
MTAIVLAYLASDHIRLHQLLDEADNGVGPTAMAPYEEFRRGLLRHMGMEESVLLPAIGRLQYGIPAPDARRLRLDHSALASLLMPPPTASVIRTIRSIFASHKDLEEGEDGVYRVLDRLAGPEATELLVKMKASPEVPVMPINEQPEVLDATRRALEKAGYELK